jgi:hypothetical protein
MQFERCIDDEEPVRPLDQELHLRGGWATCLNCGEEWLTHRGWACSKTDYHAYDYRWLRPDMLPPGERFVPYGDAVAGLL